MAIKVNILVIGSGGREHAIIWKLVQSEHVKEIYVLPGSYEIGKINKVKLIESNILNGKDFEEIAQWCKKNDIKLVVVGPEDPLADGIADILQSNGILCFGPTKAGALIESNKSWSKNFMKAWNIPTAKYQTFTDVDKAKEFINSAPYEALVVKASGLAAGKGVVVAETREEACEAVDTILRDQKYGSAGSEIVIEEKLTGEEVSLLAFVDGNTIKAMLPAQDHKRLGNQDSGPNTGGMGAYCPCPLIKKTDLDIATKEILMRALNGFRSSNITYRGVLYAGLMLTPQGPKTLEFNCRFGDPETQVLMPLLDTDLYEIMLACCEGRLKDLPIKWKENQSCVGVVMASAGYPETSTKGCEIIGLTDNTEKNIIFHSGTDYKNGKYITNGGRVLINVSLGTNLKTTAEEATKNCEKIQFSGAGAQYRTDIAHKAFKHVQLSYKDSGVDINAGDALVQRIKPLARGTNRPGVIGGLGGFGGLFQLNELTYESKNGQLTPYRDPVLVEKTSGIGEKLKLAILCGEYEAIGLDLVAMCVNDIVCSGAQPIAFLDYIACGKLNVPLVAQIIKGIADGCREANCALLGGETAEMPALFTHDNYDLAGYCVGILDYGLEIGGHNNDNLLKEGDLIIGIPASGVHCSGFNIICDIMEKLKLSYDSPAPFLENQGQTFGQSFLTPSKIYVKSLLPLVAKGTIKSAVHITNGGLLKNLTKLLQGQKDLYADVEANSWKIPSFYGWLQNVGNLSTENILKIFNCGLGLVFIVNSTDKTWKSVDGAIQIGKVYRNNTGNIKESIRINKFDSTIKILSDGFKESVSIKCCIENNDVVQQKFIENVNKLIKSTHTNEVYETTNKRMLRLFPNGKRTHTYPILVIGTDGIGSKILIAKKIKKYQTIGVDLVAMCVNDILCNGAEPLTFLDYYACNQIESEISRDIISGVINGVSQSVGSSLINGHTIQMPNLYTKSDEFDLAGFALGIVENNSILPRMKDIRSGDVVIGLPSMGVHSNGFSLVHRVMEVGGHKWTDKAKFSANNKTYGEELLIPTKIYTSAISPLLKIPGQIKAIAHITGGGLLENIPRVLTDQLAVKLDFTQINIPPVFGWLVATGNVNDIEMQRTYNCGIGMILIIDPVFTNEVLEQLTAHGGELIGTVVNRTHMTNRQQVIIEPKEFSTNLQRVQRLISQPKRRVAVLISGNGSNLQSLINATRDSTMGIGAEIVFVISNKSNVFGLERAKLAGIPSAVLNHKDYKSRELFDEAMTIELEKQNVNIICLAGFMRILSNEFVRKWKGRLINIHPSLLPRYPGLNAQKQALEAGDIMSGCTVHFVDEGMDTGKIILQRNCRILRDDTDETLTQRIHTAEHYAFPVALRMVATGLITL